jgi:hypothetical protein
VGPSQRHSGTIGYLKTYSPIAQHWGEYLRGFDWNIYGCGTYRHPVSETYAEALLKRFMEKLGRKQRCRISYFAALERRYSGCGMSPIPVHWHFLAAGKNSEGLNSVAQHLWSQQFGDARIELYDPDREGAFYVCKLVGHYNSTFLDGNLDLLPNRGPVDLIAAARINSYVPDHLKDKVFGEYLRVVPWPEEVSGRTRSTGYDEGGYPH